ncbi:GGDEF domain-containing protein [Luteimonas sp. S4-F44]|uniref:GGDEF domain-containing protein n=1 Tax=Luteimonas sp. S4-F44 TaxID=2925842 RepID=UPI001F530927|nr:GGDEF domain-containing protein [Luteimonas sp. S4-F44]UNK42981.1 GGDEF domain-containing protein [Luteimonas sp. S4-F44]
MKTGSGMRKAGLLTICAGVLSLAACVGWHHDAPVVTGLPTTAVEASQACDHAHTGPHVALRLPAPEGGWSGAPQAVVVMNTFAGSVDIQHGTRLRCGSPEDARTLDSRFRAGVGAVIVPEAGDTAPIEVGFDDNALPLWRPIVQLGQPAPIQRADIARFAVRIASITVVLTLLVSALLAFFATRERAFANYAMAASLFALWQALLSGLWAWPRPWLPVAGAAVPVLVALGLGMAGLTASALLRQSGLRRRRPRLDRATTWGARGLIAMAAVVPWLPTQAVAALSVAIELGFYLLCLAFAITALAALTQRRGDGLLLLAGVIPFLPIAGLQAAWPDGLALWKVEAFMLAGAWLALTCSMTLTLRLGRLRRQRDEMRMLAQTDALTGLPNRRAALERLEQCVADARVTDTPLTIAFLDVDHFKRINDVHGHETGDRVLRHVARALRHAFRDADHIARMGGEEFLAILPGAEPVHAQTRIDVLRVSLQDIGTALGITGLRVTLSAGVSALHPLDRDTAALLRRADSAMYAAKRGGRDRTETAAAAVA